MYLITKKSAGLLKFFCPNFFLFKNNSAIFEARDLKFLPKIIKKYILQTILKKEKNMKKRWFF